MNGSSNDRNARWFNQIASVFIYIVGRADVEAEITEDGSIAFDERIMYAELILQDIPTLDERQQQILSDMLHALVRSVRESRRVFEQNPEFRDAVSWQNLIDQSLRDILNGSNGASCAFEFDSTIVRLLSQLQFHAQVFHPSIALDAVARTA